jgi:hypothetical protein
LCLNVLIICLFSLKTIKYTFRLNISILSILSILIFQIIIRKWIIVETDTIFFVIYHFHSNSDIRYPIIWSVYTTACLSFTFIIVITASIPLTSIVIEAYPFLFLFAKSITFWVLATGVVLFRNILVVGFLLRVYSVDIVLGLWSFGYNFVDTGQRILLFG